MQRKLATQFHRRVFLSWYLWNVSNGRRWPIVPPEPKFQGPVVEHVQPREQATAAKTNLEIGITSRQRLIREAGGNPEEVFQEIEEEKEMAMAAMPPALQAANEEQASNDEGEEAPVSYTHLTLPTICSV